MKPSLPTVVTKLKAKIMYFDSIEGLYCVKTAKGLRFKLIKGQNEQNLKKVGTKNAFMFKKEV